jgi:hypothetical protein
MNRVSPKAMQTVPNAALRRRPLLAGIATLAAGGFTLPSQVDAIAVRQDTTALARSPRLIAGLKAAIGEMQRRSERDPYDPKGWRAHVQAHHAVCVAVNNTDEAQVHGCWWFLPWHRAFLAVTEWKLRAISGDPSLALPYWNWSSDRTIPAAFTRSASPLSRAVRHTPDRPLTSVEVDHLEHDDVLARLGVAALGARAFRAWTPEQIPLSFGGIARPNTNRWHGRSRFATIPHNAIHNYVGGESSDGSLGDMTELATAALDPVFYAHHANLDRLWEVWRSDPMRRASEPTDPEFLQQRFPFPWLDGTIVMVSVADTLDTRRLGYAYDQLDVFRGGAPPGALARLGQRQPLASATLTVPRRSERNRELRIAGVLPSDRPISVEIVLNRVGDPTSAITIGACAIGRRHSTPTYPDTELRFDVEASLQRLGTSSVTTSVLPLTLGPGEYQPPALVYSSIAIMAAPA